MDSGHICLTIDDFSCNDIDKQHGVARYTDYHSVDKQRQTSSAITLMI